MGKRTPGGIADQIDKKLNLTLVKYAELRNLSVSSLNGKYISLRTAEILAQDGIYIETTKSKKAVKNAN